MLVIPTKDLISMLNDIPHEQISEKEINGLFKEFGDEYYYDRTLGDFTLTVKNKNREILLGE